MEKGKLSNKKSKEGIFSHTDFSPEFSLGFSFMPETFTIMIIIMYHNMYN